MSTVPYVTHHPVPRSCFQSAWHKQVKHTAVCSSPIPAPFQKALLTLTAAAAALSLNAPPALAAEDLTITFRASRNPEISKVQRALVEAWGMLCSVNLTGPVPGKSHGTEHNVAGSSGYVETQFMDPELNHQQWKTELQVDERWPFTTALHNGLAPEPLWHSICFRSLCSGAAAGTETQTRLDYQCCTSFELL